ncbi:hypothetical protein BGW80DRAFT_1557468 [Lactifluus volemus]|nr:hypothetical protein BGW80DRAFT_1557468 [Lactifluus volemus]
MPSSSKSNLESQLSTLNSLQSISSGPQSSAHVLREGLCEGALSRRSAASRSVELEAKVLDPTCWVVCTRAEAQSTVLVRSGRFSSTELDSFRHKVEDTEREKRDLLGIVSRLKEDGAQHDKEIQTLRTSLKEAMSHILRTPV